MNIKDRGNQGGNNRKKKTSKLLILRGLTINLAERQGFEPWEQLPVHRISSAARSTTPASFPMFV